VFLPIAFVPRETKNMGLILNSPNIWVGFFLLEMKDE
jgi:hypothetical protein